MLYASKLPDGPIALKYAEHKMFSMRTTIICVTAWSTRGTPLPEVRWTMRSLIASQIPVSFGSTRTLFLINALEHDQSVCFFWITPFLKGDSHGRCQKLIDALDNAIRRSRIVAKMGRIHGRIEVRIVFACFRWQKPVSALIPFFHLENLFPSAYWHP